MKLKDKKIELLQQVHKRDEMGITKTTLEPVATLWAYFRHLSGKEIFAAATTNYKEEVLFQIDYRPDISTTHVIRYKWLHYNRIEKGSVHKTLITYRREVKAVAKKEEIKITALYERLSRDDEQAREEAPRSLPIG